MLTGMAVWSGEVFGQPGTRHLQNLWGEFLPFPVNGNAQFYLQTTSISKHKCFEAPEAKYRLQLQAEWGESCVSFSGLTRFIYQKKLNLFCFAKLPLF